MLAEAPSPSAEMARTAAAIALAGLRMAPEALPSPALGLGDDGGRSTRKRRGAAASASARGSTEVGGGAEDVLSAARALSPLPAARKRARRTGDEEEGDVAGLSGKPAASRHATPGGKDTAGGKAVAAARARGQPALVKNASVAVTDAPNSRASASASAGRGRAPSAGTTPRSGTARPAAARAPAARDGARPVRTAPAVQPTQPVARSGPPRGARPSAGALAEPSAAAQAGGAERKRRTPRAAVAEGAVDGGSGASGASGTGAVVAGVPGLLKSSRFVGVHLSHKHLLLRPWLACCWAGGKNHHLGYFKTEEEAATAYDAFARSHRKPLNFADERKGESAATKQVKASKYRGVHFKKGNKTKPWKAVCVVGGRQYHLGYHSSEEAAAAAYDSFAVQHGRALNGVQAPPPTTAAPSAALVVAGVNGQAA